jgi:hypothetical protein
MIKRLAGATMALVLAGCGPWMSQETPGFLYEGVRATFKVPQGWMTYTAAGKTAIPGPLPGDGTLKAGAGRPMRYEDIDTFDGRQAVFTLGSPGYNLQAKAACFISTFATAGELKSIMAADMATVQAGAGNRLTDENTDLPPSFPLRSFRYAHRAATCGGTVDSTPQPSPSPFRPWAVVGVPEWCDLVVARYYWAKNGTVHVMEIDHQPGVLDGGEERRIAEGFTAL